MPLRHPTRPFVVPLRWPTWDPVICVIQSTLFAAIWAMSARTCGRQITVLDRHLWAPSVPRVVVISAKMPTEMRKSFPFEKTCTSWLAFRYQAFWRLHTWNILLLQLLDLWATMSIRRRYVIKCFDCVLKGTVRMSLDWFLLYTCFDLNFSDQMHYRLPARMSKMVNGSCWVSLS